MEVKQANTQTETGTTSGVVERGRFQPVSGFMPNVIGHFHDYAEYCRTSGCIPHTSEAMRLATKALSVMWSFAQLGEIKVVGAEHLPVPGRRLIVANHSAIFDAIVMYRLIPLSYKARYMFACEFMAGNGGWRQILTGAAGAFPVNRKEGRTVVGAAIDLLVSGHTVVMFPEGAISRHAEPRAIKSGAVRIARGAYDKLGGAGELVSIIPCHIVYHKRDDATAAAEEKGPFIGTGFKWRGGVTVLFHAPIKMHEVADRSDEEVAGFYRRGIFTSSLIKLY